MIFLLLNLLENFSNAICTRDEKKSLEWWQTAVYYQVYPRSFKDSNGDGMGDLKGIEEKAEHFKDLGVDCVWISPIFKSLMADFGYDISDYNMIDPVYGTMDDFVSLQKKLQSLGKDYLVEALRFNHQKSVQHIIIPKTIRFKPRQFDGFQKVLLMFSKSNTSPKCYTEWYDPATKLRENAPGINECRKYAGFGVIRDQFVLAVGGVNGSSSKSVSMLDVSSKSPSWVPMADMLVSRMLLGVGVLDDCIYAVGGCDGDSFLKSVEVYDVSSQKWRMVTSMSTERSNFGVGVLNNRLYSVGGGNSNYLKSVEYYDPTLDIWTPVAEMSGCREGASVGVLDGLMYAIGGYNGKYLKSVEVYRPSDGVWSSIADMHLSRYCPGVAVLAGLLYVFGGDRKPRVDTLEIYNPNNNTWTLEKLSRNGVVVDRPHHYH